MLLKAEELVLQSKSLHISKEHKNSMNNGYVSKEKEWCH